MFKTLAMIALTSLIALGGGAWSVVYALQNFKGFEALSIGQWQAYPTYGSSQADPYARAQRVQQGILPLGRSEGLRFTLNHDTQGNILNPQCSYQLRGKIPAARFWSLTSLNQQQNQINIGSNIPASLETASEVNSEPGINDKLPVELHAQNIWYQPDGSFVIQIAATAQSGNWLAVPARRSYQLVLTLYDTQLGGTLGFEQVEMPVLQRIPDGKVCGKLSS